ncbi:MAG: hypothetical protein ACK56F_18855, partial [bacterium]
MIQRLQRDGVQFPPASILEDPHAGAAASVRAIPNPCAEAKHSTALTRALVTSQAIQVGMQASQAQACGSHLKDANALT